MNCESGSGSLPIAPCTRGQGSTQSAPTGRSPHSRRAWVARLALGAFALTASAAFATDVFISADDCKSKVHLVAKEVPLSHVLRQLADKLAFQVRYEARGDPLINIDSTMRPAELVSTVGKSVNLSIVERRDGRCADAWRVSSVVVLPEAGERSVVETAAPSQVLAVGTPEQARRAQEEVEVFLAETHGGPSPRVAPGD